jgi:hypothetical protein
VLWAGLAVLALARVVLGATPGMWAWGLNLHRFLPPLLAWLPWAVAAAMLVPPVARRLEPLCARMGETIVRGAPPASVAIAAAAALLVWLMPDRARFVGDFLIRQGTVEEAIRPSQVWPQALPLDVLLHYTLPLAVPEGPHRRQRCCPSAGRVGAALAALAAPRALRFAARRGGAAAPLPAFFNCTLGLFTGYNKAFTEMVVLAAAAASASPRSARGAGASPLGPWSRPAQCPPRGARTRPAAALAWVLAAHARRGRPAARTGRAAALAVPVATLTVMAPRRGIAHAGIHAFASAEIMAQGGVLGGLAGSRPAVC